MPVPDQVRDDGSGIQNIIELLSFQMTFTENDDGDEFQTIYEYVNLNLITYF